MKKQVIKQRGTALKERKLTSKTTEVSRLNTHCMKP